MRPEPGKVATIIDAAGCSFDIGLPTDPRVWSLEDGEVRERRTASRSTRGAEGRTSEQIEMVETDLVWAGSAGESPPPAAPPKRDPKPPPKATRREIGRLVAQAKRSQDPIGALEQIAADLGYKPGWVGHIAMVHGLETTT